MAYSNQSSSLQTSSVRKQEDNNLDIRDVVMFLWKLRFWIVAFVVVALMAAYVYVKMQTPVYQREARILIASGNNSNNEIAVLSDITGIKHTNNINNEVFILRSPHLMTEVVKDLNLNVRYFNRFVPHTPDAPGFLKKHFSIRTQEYYKDSPFSFEIFPDPLYSSRSLPKSLRYDFTVEGEDGFRFKEPATEAEKLKGESLLHHFGDTLVFNGYSAVFSTRTSSQLKDGNKYYVTWTAPDVCGARYAANLKAAVEAASVKTGYANRTDVVTLSINDSNIARAEDILNSLIFEYNRESLRYKNSSIINSIEFIDKRLNVISKELRDVESNYRQYQSSKALVNIQAQSQIALNVNRDYNEQLAEIRMQTQILSMIKEDMKEDEGEFRVIPSNIGISDASLSTVINSYNSMVAERNRLVANSSETNPRVKNLNQQLADMRNSIALSIDNLEKVYSIRENDISSALRQSKSKMEDIPVQQFDLTQIERKQQIIEPLYLLLQQKKEEAQISMYSAADNARVIDEAGGSDFPISPQKSKIFLLAFLLGFCIPPAFVLLYNFMRTTVLGREDIAKVLDVPVIGTIPRTDDLSLVWDSSSRDVKSESFRLLRSNLQFLRGNLIQVTSSTPDEGKSFVASNLAVSIAHTGKDVAILGLDLRNPSLPEKFKDLSVNKVNSIVGYLTGMCDDPAMTLQKCPGHPHLSVAFSGPVPPNPTELLDSDRLGTLISWMKEHFDYVIIDSAPMLPVADSVLINRHVDNTMYVVRSGHTALRILPEIKLLFEQSEIKSPKFVINDVNLKSKSMKYGYGNVGYGYGYGSHGYGFGYGYGYGYGYGSGSGDEDPGKKSFLSKLKKKKTAKN